MRCWHISAEAAARLLPPPPETRTPISGELGKVIAKMRLVDQQHRAHRLLPGWYEMGVKGRGAIKHSRAMLVELQA